MWVPYYQDVVFVLFANKIDQLGDNKKTPKTEAQQETGWKWKSFMRKYSYFITQIKIVRLGRQRRYVCKAKHWRSFNLSLKTFLQKNMHEKWFYLQFYEILLHHHDQYSKYGQSSVYVCVWVCIGVVPKTIFIMNNFYKGRNCSQNNF